MLPLAKFIKKEIELRENLVGTGFLDPYKTHPHSVKREGTPIVMTKAGRCL